MPAAITCDTCEETHWSSINAKNPTHETPKIKGTAKSSTKTEICDWILCFFFFPIEKCNRFSWRKYINNFGRKFQSRFAAIARRVNQPASTIRYRRQSQTEIVVRYTSDGNGSAANQWTDAGHGYELLHIFNFIRLFSSLACLKTDNFLSASQSFGNINKRCLCALGRRGRREHTKNINNK